MPVSPVITPSPNVGTHGYVTIVDQQGYVIGTISSSDGAQFGSVSGESQFLYNSGGPPLLDGSPSQFTFERTRSWLGKGQANGVITSTAVGDDHLTFSAPPKTLMRGQMVYISGSATEYVFVADSFIPSSTATVIPLSSPVVNAGNILARWDTFNVFGPGGFDFTPSGIALAALALQNAATGSTMTAANNANADANPTANILEVVPGLYTGSNQADRQRGPNTFRPFNAQAVTASTANTPTLIWTPASGKKFRLMGYWFSTINSAGLLFHDLASVGSGGLLNIPSPIAAAGGEIKSPPLGNGVISALANNKLWIDATSATTLTGFVWGTEE
jgi:hypothetical protein